MSTSQLPIDGRDEKKPAASKSPKRTQYAREFGAWVKKQRLNMGLSQHELAQHLDSETGAASISKLEDGQISGLKPETIEKLSKAFEVSYMEVLFHFVNDRYSPPEGEWPMIEKSIWDTIWGLVEIAKSKSLALEHIEAIASSVSVTKEKRLLLSALASWERDFADAKNCWIVAHQFIDDHDEGFFDAIIKNIKRDVRYTFFLPSNLCDKNGKFENLKNDIKEVLGSDFPLDQRLGAVRLDSDIVNVLLEDFVIMNPTTRTSRSENPASSGPEGFRILRKVLGEHEALPHEAIQLTGPETRQLVEYLRKLANDSLSNLSAEEIDLNRERIQYR